MLEMVLCIFEMLPTTRHALPSRLPSHAAPSFACWQSFQLDVHNKAVLGGSGIGRLCGQDLKDR